MRIAGVLCIVAGAGLLLGLATAGRSARAGRVWTTYAKAQCALAGVVGIVAGLLLLGGGVS